MKRGTGVLFSGFNGLFALLFIFGLIALLANGCSNSSDVSGQSPTIADNKAVIVFSDTGSQSSVYFQHRTHAEYYNNSCLECHSHTDVGSGSNFKCAECHFNNDTQGLCADDDYDHDCMAVQCNNCHNSLTPPPFADTDCTGCHPTIYSGIFVDAPVQGLNYRTQTLRGTTDNSGGFRYLAGETISFSVGQIGLGSAPAKDVMTPIDLVPGASSVEDPTVTNIAWFLQSLDDNQTHGDGILIPVGAVNASAGRVIDFSWPVNIFGNNADVAAVISGAGNSGLINDETVAQANLQITIDNLFPPATGTRIAGAPHTKMVLEGKYDSSPGTSYSYQWYSASDNTGTGEAVISGANAVTYQPTSADATAGKYFLFEVTPDSPGGTPNRSGWLGPATSANPYTYFATIGSANEVDQYIFRVSDSTDDDVIIDVLSYEAKNYSTCGNHGTSGGGCSGHHSGSTESGAIELGFGNGSCNDKLITNIFVFEGNLTTGTNRGSKNCANSPADMSACFPGSDAIALGATSPRHDRNPYLPLSGLASGDYYLMVGAPGLLETDARDGANTNGGSGYAFYTPNYYPPSHDNYKIVFSFN